MTTRSPFFLALIISLASIFTSCETDVDLNADYVSTPVIVSVLEYTTDTQFVRINRTFLGNQNPSIYAQISDSVEYDPSEVEAWLIKKKNGHRIDSIQLEPIVLPSRDPGVFFDTDITFWYTTSDLFTEDEIDYLYNNPYDMSYELSVEARGENYVAEAGFPKMNNSSITYPPFPSPNVNGGLGSKLQFYRAVSDTYQNIAFQYKTQQPTARYQGVMRLNCNFEMTDGSVLENQIIDYQLGITQHELNDQDGINKFRFNAESWYEFVGNFVKDIPNIERVRMKDLEFRLTGANNELNAYINVAQPISDFTPVLTVYSNFNNDALGILGTKTLISTAFLLDDQSVAELNNGPYAYGISYCTLAPWPGSSWSC